MAFDPRQPALFGPAAIALHDDCNVARDNFYRGRHRLNHDRLGACRTNTHDGQFGARKLRDSAHVVTSRLWELRNSSRGSGRVLAAEHRFIYWLAIDPLG